MTVAIVRRSILSDATLLRNFAEGINRLKEDFSAKVTTQTMGVEVHEVNEVNGEVNGEPMREPMRVSAYDQFVIWHHRAMGTLTPPRPSPNPNHRNAAHRGSIFLPWHRFMLRLLELHLQRVLNDATFGLPYWDWAAVGDDTTPAHQVGSALWQETGIGGTGNPVRTGPFGFPDDPQRRRFRVFFAQDAQTQRLYAFREGRGLWRQLGEAKRPARPGLPPTIPITLPTTTHVTTVLTTQSDYDQQGWDSASPDGFRNRLEGWIGPGLHNTVHVWVGGHMAVSTSPNDPVFYLHHCNVDRIWEAWMGKHGRTYLPDETSAGAPEGHRLHDEIRSLVTTKTNSPANLLDLTSLYTYDALPSA
jgi:tyrosinase